MQGSDRLDHRGLYPHEPLKNSFDANVCLITIMVISLLATIALTVLFITMPPADADVDSEFKLTLFTTLAAGIVVPAVLLLQNCQSKTPV